MSVIYLCADGEAAPDEMQSQIIVCFIFYAICLFLKLCHNAQTRSRGDSPPDAPPHRAEAHPPRSAIFRLLFQRFRRCETGKRRRRTAAVIRVFPSGACGRWLACFRRSAACWWSPEVGAAPEVGRPGPNRQCRHTRGEEAESSSRTLAPEASLRQKQ